MPDQRTRNIRRKTKRVEDPSSKQAQKINNQTPVWQHFVDRLVRFIRFGGIINWIFNDIGKQIPKREIVNTGRTDVQDRSSGQGTAIQAAHVVRAGRRSETLRSTYPPQYSLLSNFLGHTQNVPEWANKSNGLGGEIDRYQEALFEKVIDISYDGDLTGNISETLQPLKDKYLEILHKWKQVYQKEEEKKNEIEKAIKKIENISLEGLFKKGKKAQRGDYNEFYMKLG